ncbi:transcription factor Tfb4 [Eremomyces bilateralis CBS 781.70]|uniref:General transcription and DNA repair factor IIH subunit TFB4 n=1 Tax=Eremomyces bilateralis CBS 781.70 TaxID=1392243 RepID=A0A6G1GGQ6_9PEZI|nr:transcription factor Tfb4 [Eremomyces bilateralis CBS 781.70]KAF1817194.1 transcription factor Tfb4 [Eremomyces bilateralis CBS 781.70]
MNAIDGTTSSFHVRSTDAPPPSLLVIVLDTNPYAWSLLADTLPLQNVVANLLVFINAHLAINHANQVAVLASHTHCVQWLYPPPPPPLPTDSTGDVLMTEPDQPDPTPHPPTDDANKYRPFRLVEQQILSNLRSLLTSSPPSSHTTALIAGALTTAMTYISKATLLASPVAAPTHTHTTSSVLPTADAINAPADASTAHDPLSSRILIVSVSGDLAAQYIPVMNTIFAAQRNRVPIDVLKLAGDTVFLQQASDATGGVYIAPGLEVGAGKKEGEDAAVVRAQGILQYLMMGFLPDAAARKWLVLPGAEEVDFRAACFCHRKVVDIGWVCSVCLSIFCEPLPDATCLTCGTYLALPANHNVAPAVVPRKKKKKKRLPDGGTPRPGGSTPAGSTPGGGTPMR